MTREEAFAFVQGHMAALSEHFEAVQIFASRCDGEKTESIHVGAGNWYARMGMVQDFMVKENAIARREAIAQSEDDDE